MSRRLAGPLWAWGALYLATLLAYWPMLRGAILWDDDAHVTKPALRSLHGLGRIWFEVGATQQYYPVLHSAFWLEHRLWGDATLGYHLFSVFLHATAACLFAVVLRRLGKGEHLAWFAAFLFALHPVGVESVAWISEQKNTLSGVFYLLAALTYLMWREGSPIKVGAGGPPVRTAAESKAEADGRAARPYLYWIASLFFLLALLSKSVTATLPAALLVILWWRRGRLSGRDDVAPLLPWFALGAAAGLFTAWVERRYIGAEGAAFSLTLLERGLLAGRVAWFYLGKLVWPANLMFTYPHWTVAAGAGWFLFPIGAAAVLAGLWLWRGRSRGPLAGALFFVGSLFPALGFVNVYPFRFSYVADHFQYLASLGILALAAAGWAGGLRQSRIVAVLLLGVLGVLTWKQSRLYRDPQVLYRETLRRNPEAWIVDASLGATLVGEGRPAEALPFYEEALRLAPDYAQGYYDLGNALAKVGRGPAAIDAYRQALRLKPFYVDAHNNLGVALAESGQVSAAVAEYEQALRLQPDQVPARNNLANALVRLHRPAEAIAQYEEALRLSPGLAEAHYGLGLALATSGRLAEAIGHYREALRLNPNYAEAHANLAGALANSGQLAEAVAQFEEALRLQPGSAAVRYNLALALRAEGRMEDARAQFEEARRLEANP